MPRKTDQAPAGFRAAYAACTRLGGDARATVDCTLSAAQQAIGSRLTGPISDEAFDTIEKLRRKIRGR